MDYLFAAVRYEVFYGEKEKLGGPTLWNVPFTPLTLPAWNPVNVFETVFPDTHNPLIFIYLFTCSLTVYLTPFVFAKVL
jgi:hypothetical protein